MRSRNKGLIRIPLLFWFLTTAIICKEHTQWAKFTNYNTSTQVPLIIYNPLAKAAGSTDALTALVDIYPTLAEICGLKPPVDQLDGTSLVAVMSNPKLEGKKACFH
jgi:arylsulfatase A-like enzyme